MSELEHSAWREDGCGMRVGVEERGRRYVVGCCKDGRLGEMIVVDVDGETF